MQFRLCEHVALNSLLLDNLFGCSHRNITEYGQSLNQYNFVCFTLRKLVTRRKCSAINMFNLNNDLIHQLEIIKKIAKFP